MATFIQIANLTAISLAIGNSEELIFLVKRSFLNKDNGSIFFIVRIGTKNSLNRGEFVMLSEAIEEAVRCTSCYFLPNKLFVTKLVLKVRCASNKR